MTTDIENNRMKYILSLLEKNWARGNSSIDTITVFAALLFLRWMDWYDTEQEAIASFEEKEYQPVLPWNARWNVIKNLSQKEINEYYENRLLPSLEKTKDSPHARNLTRIGEILQRGKMLENSSLHGLIRFIDQLPFATLKDHREAGKIFDSVLQKANQYMGSHILEYSTPAIVSGLMVELIDPQPGEKIYDPYFGTGDILLECALKLREKSSHLSPRVWSQVQQAGIFGMGPHPLPYVLGLTRLVLAGIHRPGLELGNTLERMDLSNRSEVQFDCILAKPPWGGQVPMPMQSYFPIKTSDRVGLFVQHIISALKPGGRAVIIVPTSFLFRTGSIMKIRRRLLEEFRVAGVIALPSGVFLPYTGIESNLILLRRETPVDTIRFMRVPEIESRKTPGDTENIKREIKAIVQKFQKGKLNSILWETTVKDISKNDWDLQARHTGDDHLEAFFHSLQEIEEDIDLESLEKIADVFAGVSYDRSITSDKKEAINSLPLLRVADLSTTTVTSPGLFLTGKTRERINNNLITKPGDILISASGTIGKTGIIDQKFVGAVPAKSIITVRCKKTVLPGYLHLLLMSAPYQEWLKGHALGAVIQQLSIRTLKHLVIPVPKLQVQEQLYKTSQHLGGDPANILLRLLSGIDIHPLVSWLESAPEVDEIRKGKQFETRNDRLPLLEKFAQEIEKQRNNSMHQQYKDLPREVMTWLDNIATISANLIGINDIPEGPAKYSILETTRLNIQNAVNPFRDLTLPVLVSIRELSQKLQELILVEIESTLTFNGFVARINQEYIQAGKESEVSLAIINPTPLVFKDLKIETIPGYGKMSKKYFAEKEEISMVLHFPPQSAAGQLDFVIRYKCLRLDGKEIQGDIPYSIEIKSIRESLHITDIGESPYNCTQAVERKEMFFGRQELLFRIKSHLTKLQPSGVILLEGNRRMGKTSILKRILADGWLPGHIVILCSLQAGQGEKQEVGLSTAEIFRLLTREIGCQLYDNGIETWVDQAPPRKNLKPFKKEFKDSLKEIFDEGKPVEIFETYLQDIFEAIHPKRLLLMIDEFDKLQEGIDHGITSPMVPDNLRYLIQTYKELSIMMVGSRRLKHLRSHYWSALFGLGEPMGVGPLRREDAANLVTEPVKGRLNYIPEARDKIVSMCACRANLVQMMCDHLFYMAKQQGERIISYKMVETAAQRLTEDNEHFATLWQENCQNERQRLMLVLCVQMIAKEEAVTFLALENKLREYKVPVTDVEIMADIEHLEEMELIQKDPGNGGHRYNISIPLFSDWLNNRSDFQIQLRKTIRECEEK